MKRVLAVALVAAAAVTGGANAAAPRASCVGLLTSFEATQLPTGAVASEVTALAHAGTLSALARAEAHQHTGSLESCVAD